MTKKKFLKLFLILLPCVLVDQITKYLAKTFLISKKIDIIRNVLELTYLENRGAAWGSFQGQTIGFIIFTILMVGFLLFVYFKMPLERKYIFLEYLICLIVAGATGNFIDRLCYGYVVDFISFTIINFPVFNVADILVTCSVIVMAILILFYYKDEDFEWLKLKR